MDNITLTLFNSHKEGQSSRSRTQQLLDVVTRDRRKDISRFLKDHGYSISVMQEKQENGVKLKKEESASKNTRLALKWPIIETKPRSQSSENEIVQMRPSPPFFIPHKM